MKIKLIRFIIVLTFICIMLCGCKNDTKTSFLENVPEPEIYFSGSDFKEYYIDSLNLKGITVTYSGDDIKADYDKYISDCKNLGIWVNPVFNGDTSWCYQNEDKTMQIAINLSEENGTIDICIKNLGGK